MKVNSLTNLMLQLKLSLGLKEPSAKEFSSLTETEYLLSGKNGAILRQSLKEAQSGNIKKNTP